MPKERRLNYQEDHDTLIRDEVKVDRALQDIAQLRDGLAKDVAKLEVSKLDKEEANRLVGEAEKLHADHERRIRFLERGYWWGIGALAVLQIVVAWYITYHK